MGAALSSEKFSDALLILLYDEIRASPRMAATGRTIWSTLGPPTSDKVVDEALVAAHSPRRHIADNHALGALSGFDILAFSPTRPF